MFQKAASFSNNELIHHKLYTTGFDNEGIWNQLQLLNQVALTKMQELRDLPEVDDELVSVNKDEVCSNESMTAFDADNDPEEIHIQSYEEDLDMESIEEDIAPTSKSSKLKRSIVDDDFFSLEAMEKFATMGEELDIRMSKMTPEDINSETDDENDIFSIGKGILKH
jgi:U3 small nucleolar RNA-associated protein MPP10